MNNPSSINLSQINDMSLITPIPMRALNEVMLEKDFYSHHPGYGKFKNHPIWGQVIEPTKLTAEERAKLFKKGSVFPDHTCELIKELKDATEAVYEKPTALYVHCEAGVDRTGEVIACYRMLVQSWSYKEAMKEAEDFAQRTSKRSIVKFSKMGIQWYAYYLKEILGVETVGDIDDNSLTSVTRLRFQ